MRNLFYFLEDLGALLLFKKNFKSRDANDTIVIHDTGERIGYWFLGVFVSVLLGFVCFGLYIILMHFWMYLLILAVVCTVLGFALSYIGTLGIKVCNINTLINETEDTEEKENS